MTKKLLLTTFAFAMLCINVYAGGNKMVFSKTTIDEEAGKSLSDATFQLGDDIYLRYYLKKDLGEYIDSRPRKFIDIIVKSGGKVLATQKMWTDDGWAGYADKASYQFFLNQILSAESLNNINNLEVGTHEITVEINAKNSDKLVVSGSFKLVKKDGNKMTKGKLGVSFNSLVTAKMTDPALEAKVLKALQERTFLKVVKFKIISGDWSINKKPSTGAILGRYIDVGILVKDEFDNCVINIYRLEQQYNGSGYQDSFGGFVGVALNGNNQYFPLHAKPVDCE